MSMKWDSLLNAERLRPSTIQGDIRVEFERDFDRAVFSTPLKRLQDKAQVFPLEPHDAVRTRLTHSLEVSAVARGLAIRVGKWLATQGHIAETDRRSIEAIAATAGLLHDLGNPPFGHSGEEAIREWFVCRGKDSLQTELRSTHFSTDQLVQDFLTFEGNAQTLRLVARLQILADYYGLNLTFGTLSAMCKYIAASHEIDSNDASRKKPGYFASEASLVTQVRDKTCTGSRRNPIAFLVEAADDIVYSVADIEDAVKKGVLTWKELKELLQDDVDQMKGVLTCQRTILESDGTGDELGELPDDVRASAFRTAAISVLVPYVSDTFGKHYAQIMDGGFRSDLVSVCEGATIIQKLRTIGQARVYCTPSNLKLELMGRHVIRQLMDVFWEAAEGIPIDGHAPKPGSFVGKLCSLLSENYRRVFLRSVNGKDGLGLPETYHRYRLLTDWICGMTDSFARRLHAELFNG